MREKTKQWYWMSLREDGQPEWRPIFQVMNHLSSKGLPSSHSQGAIRTSLVTPSAGCGRNPVLQRVFPR